MNPELSRALVSNHIRDLRREAALAAGPSRSCRSSEVSGPSGRAALRPRLRSRVGFALVEAGLRLLADRSVLAVRPRLRGRWRELPSQPRG